MKKLMGFLIAIFLLYITYYDLSTGTLSIVNAKESESEPKEAVQENVPPVPYVDVKIKAGDTVLSIVEELHKEGFSVSIQDIVKDFAVLNPGHKADAIQIGKTYKIPIYKSN